MLQIRLSAIAIMVSLINMETQKCQVQWRSAALARKQARPEAESTCSLLDPLVA